MRNSKCLAIRIITVVRDILWVTGCHRVYYSVWCARLRVVLLIREHHVAHATAAPRVLSINHFRSIQAQGFSHHLPKLIALNVAGEVWIVSDE